MSLCTRFWGLAGWGLTLSLMCVSSCLFAQTYQDFDLSALDRRGNDYGMWTVVGPEPIDTDQPINLLGTGFHSLAERSDHPWGIGLDIYLLCRADKPRSPYSRASRIEVTYYKDGEPYADLMQAPGNLWLEYPDTGRIAQMVEPVAGKLRIGPLDSDLFWKNMVDHLGTEHEVLSIVIGETLFEFDLQAFGQAIDAVWDEIPCWNEPGALPVAQSTRYPLDAITAAKTIIYESRRLAAELARDDQFQKTKTDELLALHETMINHPYQDQYLRHMAEVIVNPVMGFVAQDIRTQVAWGRHLLENAETPTGWTSQQDAVDAYRFAEKLHGEHPNNVGVLLLMADFYLRPGTADGAHGYLTQAEALNGNDPKVHLGWSKYHWYRGDIPKTRAALARALTLSKEPGLKVQAQIGLMELAAIAEDKAAMRRHYNAAHELLPWNHELHQSYGLSLLWTGGNLSDALAATREAVELSDDPFSLYALGLVLYANWAHSKDERLYREAGYVLPDRENALYDLASMDTTLFVAEALAEAGADINARNWFGDTPLRLAAEQGRLETVRRLIERGADVNHAGFADLTPLMSAAGAGHLEVVKLLIQSGASPDTEVQGQTAASIALAARQVEVVDYLAGFSELSSIPSDLRNTEHQDELDVRAIIQSDAISLFMEGDYDTLEMFADGLRTTKARTPSGVWKLRWLYVAFTEYADVSNSDTSYWDALLSKTVEWMQIDPASVAACIVHGAIMDGRMVGLGRSSRNISFRSLAEQTARFLENNKSVCAEDPHWYVLMIRAAHFSRWNEDKFAALVDEATARFPDYHQIYFAATDHYLPSSGGSNSAIDDFARYAVSRSGNDAMYARVYWVADTKSREPLYKTQIDTEYFAQSVRAVIADYPDPWNINNFARMACTAHARELARDLLAQLNGQPDPRVWPRNLYEECQGWANPD